LYHLPSSPLMLPFIAHKEVEMPHAIIRRENGRSHEVDFGNAPDRVEIYASEETVANFHRGGFRLAP
jgi:hypothetical protein